MEEIMNYEDEIMDNEIACIETEAEGSSMSTGAAMLIGAGLTLAVTATVKLAKKLVAKHKAKKELKLVKEDDFVEVTDEQINEITK